MADVVTSIAAVPGLASNQCCVVFRTLVYMIIDSACYGLVYWLSWMVGALMGQCDNMSKALGNKVVDRE